MYFSKRERANGRRASTYTARELRKILKTNIRVPGAFEITPEGMIIPNFVAWKVVEKAFEGDETEFLRKLMEPVESRHNQLSGVPMQLKFSDEEIAARVQAICRNELKVESHLQLSRKELYRLCRKLSIRFGCSPDQLQRVVGVNKTELEDWL